MLPIADENVPGRSFPIVTIALIVINALVFVLLQLPNDAFTYGFSAIPREITTGVDLVNPVRQGGVPIPQAPGPEPIYLTLLSSMFMHGGWLHLIGNMLFLYIFGDNVEHAVGSLVYLAFYVVAGVVASLAQIFLSPDSAIPSLGASGAISGVLAAYLVLFPGNRVLVVFFYAAFWVPALVAIGLWAVLQFIGGLGQIAMTEQTGGVAYAAHIGGFVVGLAFGVIARGFARIPRAYGRR